MIYRPSWTKQNLKISWKEGFAQNNQSIQFNKGLKLNYLYQTKGKKSYVFIDHLKMLNKPNKKYMFPLLFSWDVWNIRLISSFTNNSIFWLLVRKYISKEEALIIIILVFRHSKFFWSINIFLLMLKADVEKAEKPMLPAWFYCS